MLRYLNCSLKKIAFLFTAISQLPNGKRGLFKIFYTTLCLAIAHLATHINAFLAGCILDLFSRPCSSPSSCLHQLFSICFLMPLPTYLLYYLLLPPHYWMRNLSCPSSCLAFIYLFLGTPLVPTVSAISSPLAP